MIVIPDMILVGESSVLGFSKLHLKIKNIIDISIIKRSIMKIIGKVLRFFRGK